MKWIMNMTDPKSQDARVFILTVGRETPEQAWQRQERYLSDKIIGEPKATDHYSVAELKAMGKVGVYDAD